MPWMSCSSIRHAVKVELLLHNSPSPEEAQLLRRAQEVSAHTKITTIVPTLNYALICFDIRYAYLYMIYQWYYWMAGERDWRKQYLGHGRGGCTLHGYNVCARCMSLCSAARTFCCRWSPSRASNCDWKSGTLWTPLRCQNGEMQWNAMKCNEMHGELGVIWISFEVLNEQYSTIFTIRCTMYNCTTYFYALQCPKKASCLPLQKLAGWTIGRFVSISISNEISGARSRSLLISC